MDMSNSALARARRQLETSGRFPGGALPPDIADSWLRCLSHGIDALAPSEQAVVTSSELTQIRRRNDNLIRFARPELELLYDQIAGSNFMIALGSPDGVVLDTLSDPEFQDTLAGKAVISGSVWTEKVRGTNALGLTLETHRPAQVYGGEHFLRAHGDVACISAPIFDGRCNLAGILDASSGSTVRQQHTAALVMMSASNIENGLMRVEHDNSIVLQFHPRPEYLGTLSSGMLVLDETFQLHAINRRGTSFLTGFNPLIGMGFEEVFASRFEDLASALVRGETLRVRDRLGSAVSMRCVANRASFRLAGSMHPATSVHHLPDTCREPSFANTMHMPAFSLRHVVYDDPYLRRQFSALPKALAKGLNILITGELGTGKEVAAQTVHAASGRRGPFVVFDAKIVDTTSAVTDLFGQPSGDAGLIAAAEGGTLFLDEIANLPAAGQAALAGFLARRKYRHAGSSQMLSADVLIVSSSSTPLADAVAASHFREDLRYRLQGYEIHLPPLSARGDFAALARRMLVSIDPDCRIEEPAIQNLMCRAWPGNLHELRDTLTRSALAVPDKVLRACDLKLSRPAPETDWCRDCDGTLWKEQNCRFLRQTVVEVGGNIAVAARHLGVSRTTLYKHLRN